MTERNGMTTETEKEEIQVEYPEFPDDVQEVYLVPAKPPIARCIEFRWFRKIYPLPWWRRWCCCHWFMKCHQKKCCCCCPTQPTPAPIVASAPNSVAPPTIVLSQGYLAAGGQFYLLITPQGSRCQFIVEWMASGGVGQRTVDLDVQASGSTSFQSLASGLGPNDQYLFTGARSSYLFRATVTDSRGESTFDTLSVTCP